VVPFHVQDADEIYAIRRRLEPFAVELAVQAMTSEAMSDIEALFADLSKAARRRQLESYIDLNVKFHMAIYEASGMGRLVSIIRRLYVGVPPLTPIMLEGRLGRSQKEHEEIMRRLVARDQSGAAAAMDRHIGNAGAELRKTMAAGTKLRRDTSTRRRSKNDHG
jgi:DNA-binding GntR family transcriptional regulator